MDFNHIFPVNPGCFFHLNYHSILHFILHEKMLKLPVQHVGIEPTNSSWLEARHASYYTYAAFKSTPCRIQTYVSNKGLLNVNQAL